MSLQVLIGLVIAGVGVYLLLKKEGVIGSQGTGLQMPDLSKLLDTKPNRTQCVENLLDLLDCIEDKEKAELLVKELAPPLVLKARDSK